MLGRILIAIAVLSLAAPFRCLAAPPPPDVHAGAAVLMEPTSGRILFEREAYQRRPPASTGKVVTALTALRLARVDRAIRVSHRAAGTPGSRAHIRPDRVYTLGELLKGLLLRSGNDAATAIAEGTAGSEASFMRRANAVALSLGAMNTHLVNPHGLDRPLHYTTARDLAVFAAAVLRDPRLSTVVGSHQSVFDGRIVTNTNSLLGSLPGANGVKTGTTSRAGKCLIASARREGLTLIAVVLNAPDRYGEARTLLEWGFHHFRITHPVHRGEQVGTWRYGPLRVPIVAEGDLVEPVPVDETTRVEMAIRSSGILPRGTGARVGVLSLVGAHGTLARTYAVLGAPLPTGGLVRWGDGWVRFVGFMRSVRAI